MERGSTFGYFSCDYRSSRDSLTRLVTLDRVTRIDAALRLFWSGERPPTGNHNGLADHSTGQAFSTSHAAVLALSLFLLAADSLKSAPSGKQALLGVKLAKSCSNNTNMAERFTVYVPQYHHEGKGFLQAKRILVVAFGENKVGAVTDAVEGNPSDACAASQLQGHNNTLFHLDIAAAHGKSNSFSLGKCPMRADATAGQLFYNDVCCHMP